MRWSLPYRVNFPSKATHRFRLRDELRSSARVEDEVEGYWHLQSLHEAVPQGWREVREEVVDGRRRAALDWRRVRQGFGLETLP